MGHWRKFKLDLTIEEANMNRANLARAGHSVFVIEAGEDHGDSRLQQIPIMYVIQDDVTITVY